VATRKPPPKHKFFLAILNFDLAKSLILASQKKKKKKAADGPSVYEHKLRSKYNLDSSYDFPGIF